MNEETMVPPTDVIKVMHGGWSLNGCSDGCDERVPERVPKRKMVPERRPPTDVIKVWNKSEDQCPGRKTESGDDKFASS